MTQSEFYKALNVRLTDLSNYIIRGNIPSYDKVLAKLFSDYYLQSVNGIPDNIKKSVDLNIVEFSIGKSTYIIEDMLNNKSILDEYLQNIKDKTFNYSLVEDNIVKSRVQQVKNFEEWSTKKDAYLTYVTAGDEKVRESHAALDGLTLPINHPIWKEISPRVAYGCRCTIKRVLRPTNISTTIPDIKGVSDPGIAKNTFYTGLIFDKTHTYFNI